jgi:crotonobetainyl-CoA:carnitine CoA-transferase CaiB-like acyl-CoA transferase
MLDRATEQALSDLKVVEFTAGMAGPWIGRFMAHCGAEVIRVESRKYPGVVRLYVPPWDRAGGVREEMSPWFTDWEAGKLFVALDLTKPEAVQLARRLVARADVVIENQSSGVMAKLGLAWEDLIAVNPQLIMLSSSGYGDSGPHSSYVTWGPNIEAMAGLGRLSGFPERDCTTTQFAYPDSLSALHGLFAILCALDHRARTGEGQRISLSQLEATVGMIGPQMMDCLAHDREPAKLGNRSLHAAPHGCYRCAGEDRWCVISVFDDAQWRALCETLGLGAWTDDPRFANAHARLENTELIDARISSWTELRSPHEVMEILQSAGVPAGAVQDTEDQFERDPHLKARGFFETIPHLTKGEVVATGIPVGLTRTPGHTRESGARMGEHNAYVFRDLLELSPEEIRGYEEIGAIENGD